MSLFYALDVLIHDMFCFVTILYAVTTIIADLFLGMGEGKRSPSIPSQVS